MVKQNKRKKGRLVKKINRRLFLARKDLRRVFPGRDGAEQQVLLIIGCQRSGTTLVTEILESDWDARVYPEHSRLSSQDAVDGLRLNPLPQVKAEIARQRYPLVVLKPLVETQNADRLLESFPGAKAVWMLRHYKDVARSNLERFGPSNGIKNLRSIAAGQVQNWRAERLPKAVADLVKAHFSETMNPYDAAALFWYVRNTFYFDLRLDQRPDVLLCRYADLVQQPAKVIRDLYGHVERPYPGDRIVEGVFKSSLGRGQHLELSSQVESLCQAMWERFEAHPAGPGSQGVDALATRLEAS